MTDYSELGFSDNLNKEDAFLQYNYINPDTQIEDESIMGTKLMQKSVALDRLYGENLQVGGTSNISGTIQLLNSANSAVVTIDSTNGIKVVDGSGNIIFNTNVGTDNVQVGTFNGIAGNGTFYDGGTGNFTISGSLNAGSIDINGGTFQVTSAGVMTATSGTIGGWNIGASTLYSDSSNVVLDKTGIIQAGDLGSGNGVSLTSLSGTGNLNFYYGGTLRATITGVTATRATGISNNGDYVAANNRSYLIRSSTGGATEYGGIGITNANQFWLTMGTANTFYLYNNAQTTPYFTVSASKTYSENEMWVNSDLKFGDGSSISGHNVQGVNKILPASSNWIYIQNAAGTTDSAVNINCGDGGKMYVNKNQIVLGGLTLTLTGTGSGSGYTIT